MDARHSDHWHAAHYSWLERSRSHDRRRLLSWTFWAPAIVFNATSVHVRVTFMILQTQTTRSPTYCTHTHTHWLIHTLNNHKVQSLWLSSTWRARLSGQINEARAGGQQWGRFLPASFTRRVNVISIGGDEGEGAYAFRNLTALYFIVHVLHQVWPRDRHSNVTFNLSIHHLMTLVNWVPVVNYVYIFCNCVLYAFSFSYTEREKITDILNQWVIEL